MSHSHRARQALADAITGLETLWTTNRLLRGAVLGALVAAGLSLPSFLGLFHISLATRILIWATVATGFNFAFGFANVLSLGHATFYGIGAYGVVIALQEAENIPFVNDGLVVPIVIALAGAGIAALFIGYISLRSTGIYFALLTLGFAEIIHQLILKAEITGGTSGMLLPTPDFPLGLSLDLTTVYYLAFLFFVFTLVTHYWILNSPFGRVMQAIRSNQERAEALGYPVERVKLTVFVISALYTSIGGVLFVLMNQFVGPSVASLEIMINLLISTIIGGMTFLSGPFVGAVFLVLINYLTRDLRQVGVVIIGVTFIIVILFMPNGIVGKLKDLIKRLAET